MDQEGDGWSSALNAVLFPHVRPYSPVPSFCREVASEMCSDAAFPFEGGTGNEYRGRDHVLELVTFSVMAASFHGPVPFTERFECRREILPVSNNADFLPHELF